MMESDVVRWRSHYERDGYVVVEDCLDGHLLAALRGGIERITADPDGLPAGLRRHLDMERDYVAANPQYNDLAADKVGNAVRNIMELPLFDRLFADLIVYPPVLDILEILFGSTEFHFHNYKCIIKAPRVGSRFCWHRDLPYLQHSGPNLITAMLCMDDMTERNGATVVLPGTHRIAHASVGPGDMDIAEKDLPPVPRVTVTCPAGSVVLFHVNIIHGGGPNHSEFPRRNVIGIWSGPDTYPITAARYAYQDLMPRSGDPARQRQVRLTFPHLFGSAQ
jgi:ectoine hydroxylase-related dioxygenase (phytanoyl-CoA dioxygenase family)